MSPPGCEITLSGPGFVVGVGDIVGIAQCLSAMLSP